MNRDRAMLRAALFARLAHGRAQRRYLPEDFFQHPARVAAAAEAHGLSEVAQIAGWLHDVVEDTHVTLADVRLQFPEATPLVRALTKWWPDEARGPDVEQWKLVWVERMLAEPEAPDLKVLDRTDNLKDLTRALRRGDLRRADREGLRRWATRYAAKTPREMAPLLSVVRASVRVVYEDAHRALVRELERVTSGEGLT